LARNFRQRHLQIDSDNPIAQTRAKTQLSQSEFAGLLGISKRTLEHWEQGRRKPNGAAQTLLKIAQNHPEILRDLR
jgi:putative transcriptional regulator